MIDKPLLTPLVHSLMMHATLSDADREAIFSLPVFRRDVTPSTYIVREGEKADNCSILIEGYAFRQKLTGDGSRQITSLHIPGDALDFQNVFLPCADHNVQALTKATLAVIPRFALVGLVTSRAAVAHAVLMAALVEASICREWVANVGRRNARTRIAHLLCEYATRMDHRGLSNGGEYHFPMTQEQLGDATGLTSVHVNRMVKTLEAEGLIKREGRSFSFPSIESLRTVADFSSLYLHTDGR